MRYTRTRILGGASLAGLAAAITLAFAPCAHAQASGYSYQSGGGNMALADGSVRFISYSTNQLTYTALGSRNGGEVVPDW